MTRLQSCRRVRPRVVTTVVAAGLLLAGGVATRTATATDRDEADAAATEFFTTGRVPRLQIRLSAEAADSLRSEPRTWVACTLVEDGDSVHERVAIRIKGSVGSGRDLDDRPAFTVNMDRHERGRRFHGLDKFHLNNAVQDESLLRERLGAEIFHAAGIPAPRVTHARVWIDGRDVGLYVLKESYDEDFLRRSFPRPDGNLYDGGAGQDIDEGLERDEGRRGEPGADLAAIVSACRLVDDATRFGALEHGVEIDAFLAFAALEAMTGHWDGYVQARNNYRVYLDPEADGRARFLPHGMDQIFQDPHADVHEPPRGLLAAAILENPTWRQRYRERLREFVPLFAAEERLLPLVGGTVDRLRPIVVDMGPEPLERFDAAVAALRDLLVEREASLREQAEAAGPIVWPTRLQAAVRALNAAAEPPDEAEIPDTRADAFLRDHAPWFECPDEALERGFYRRWWLLRRHVRHTDAGPVLANLPEGFGDPLGEVQWLRDLRLADLDGLPRTAAAEADGSSIDHVITQVVGLKTHPGDMLEVDPAPPRDWAWFALDRVPYHGRRLTIVWDETGERYGRGDGLRLFVDGAEVAHRDALGRILTWLP